MATQVRLEGHVNIGEAAKAAGVSAKMIRYYESIGIIAPVSRGSNRYRVYTPADVHTLRFVKRGRDLGFAIEDIRRLVGLWRDANRSSAEVKAIALTHVTDLKRKIVELQSMLSALEHLAGHCHGDHRPECPILDDLGGTRVAAVAGTRPRRPVPRGAAARPGKAPRKRFETRSQG